jgi:hypothetical protein
VKTIDLPGHPPLNQRTLKSSEKLDVYSRKKMVSRPTIGILANFRQDQIKPLGKQTNLIKGFLSAAKELGFEMGVFLPRELAEHKYPTGYYLGTDTWKEKKASSYPAIVFDRFYSSLKGFDLTVQKQKLYIEKKMGVRFLNPLLLAERVTDKKYFSTIMNNSNIRSPEVIASSIDNIDVLWRTIASHRDLILKPRFGRMGQCVFRLAWKHNFVTVFFENRHLHARNKWQLLGILNYFCMMNNITTRHLLLQKMIPIKMICNRFFDVRVLIQRTSGNTAPIITGEVVRLSQTTGNVPNIDQGGIVMPLESCLAKAYPCSWPTLCQNLRQQALKIYSLLENQYGLIGELGLDFLIDSNNEIWTIEINSKPGRIAFERLASGFGLSHTQKLQFAEKRKISILNPVKYCCWLAENALLRTKIMVDAEKKGFV